MKIAIIQATYEKDNISFNTKKGIEFIKKSKDLGVDIVLFPECWLNGYSFPNLNNLTNEQMFEMDEFDGKEKDLITCKEYVDWKNKALNLNSKYINEFCEIAKNLKIGVVLTCYTKGDFKPRNTALIIDKNGEIILKYDKVHTCDFSLECMLESGKEFKVCDFEGIKLGVMICYDREYPESARVLMLKGAEIILIPNCCEGMENRINTLKTRAYENMVGVVMANVPSKNGGMSCAISPIAWDKDGNCLKMEKLIANNTSEDIYVVEYNLEELRQYRKNEMMGNTFRKIEAYSEILSNEIKEPFLRNKWIEN